MVAACEVAPDRLTGAVAQQQAAIVTVEGVAKGGVDADTRRAAGEDERVDAVLAQDRVQLRLEEPAVAVLGNDEIAFLGRELGQDFCSPRSSDERSTFPTIGRRHDLTDT